MTDLRALARDQNCMVRLPGVCNGSRATVVLAHYRLIGLSGMGLKPHELLGAYACSDCHDAIDGRRRPKHITREAAHLAHAEGVMRTINQLLNDGVIKP